MSTQSCPYIMYNANIYTNVYLHTHKYTHPRYPRIIWRGITHDSIADIHKCVCSYAWTSCITHMHYAGCSCVTVYTFVYGCDRIVNIYLRTHTNIHLRTHIYTRTRYLRIIWRGITHDSIADIHKCVYSYARTSCIMQIHTQIYISAHTYIHTHVTSGSSEETSHTIVPYTYTKVYTVTHVHHGLCTYIHKCKSANTWTSTHVTSGSSEVASHTVVEPG